MSAAVPPATNQRNFALGLPATQSSTGFDAPAPFATDGNTNGHFSVRSTTSTGLQANPWWQVDLGSSRDIDLVRVWNRTDCCAERLRDFWVFLSATPFTSDDPATLSRDPGVTAIRVGAQPNPFYDVTVTALARYVRIQLPRTEYLSLTEVQVIGQPWITNYATDATVSQSSGRFDGDAFHANDTNPNGSYAYHSVSHTARQLNPWWQADIGFSRYISEIRLWNRTDCCAERLSNFWVQVSDVPFTSNDPAVVANQSWVRNYRITSPPSPMTVLPINAYGRYVRVQLQGTEALSLAEVEILGPQLRDFVPGGVATQSSTSHGGIPEYAQDGNTSGLWAQSSITATADQANPWWQVALATPQNITRLKISNRTDCCVDRLRDFWVFLSPTPFISDNPSVVATQQPNVKAIRVTKTPSPYVVVDVGNVPAQYIRIQVPGSGILSLAEVEAYGTETLAPVNAAAWNAQHPLGLFVNYGMQTTGATDRRYPGPPASTFNPGTTVYPSSWAAAMQSAGMKFGVLTAKDWDGFAMWRTNYSNYSIAASPYQNGQGDIVRDYANAMRAANLDVGLYYSVWDVTNNASPAFIKNQLRELLTRYGTISYLYLGEWLQVRGSQHKMPYNDLRDYIRNISPNTIIANEDTMVSLLSSDLVSSKVFDGIGLFPARDSDPKATATPLSLGWDWYWWPTLGAPHTASWVSYMRQRMREVNSNLVLAVGPRLDGTIDPRYVTVLQQIGTTG